MKFPRQQRFVLAAAIQRAGLDFQEHLIEATLGAQPTRSLQSADVALAKLRLYLRLSHDFELLSGRQYAHVTKMVTEVGRLLGGWRKAQSKAESV